MTEPLLGQHLLLDGVSRYELDPDDLGYFLEQCPRVIKMTIIRPAEIHRTVGGLCGLEIIASSHISVHTQGHEVHADIFSCMTFDTFNCTQPSYS